MVGPLLGLLVGGGLVWLELRDPEPGSCTISVDCALGATSEGFAAIVAITLGATGGAIIGFAVGSAFRTDRWVERPILEPTPTGGSRASRAIAVWIALPIGDT